MIGVSGVAVSEQFPKSSRLLKRRDFRFESYRRFQTTHFTFLYTQKGQGRLGISISKKVLKASVARNRVRRLLREVFRTKPSETDWLDVHVVGVAALKENWKKLTLKEVEKEFEEFLKCSSLKKLQ